MKYTICRGRVLGGAGIALAALALALAPGCDFLDPTSVENPQTTEEDLRSAQNPTAALLPGLRAQFGRALRAVVVTSETVSDNYSIESTGLSKEVDDPYLINPSVGMITGGPGSVTGAYFHLQELRALADFLLNEIAPNDTTAVPAALAEARFYRGMALLMQGENFVAVPTELDGEPVPAEQLLERAVTDFEAVLATDAEGNVALPELATPARAALARTHRMLGNAAEAHRFAEAALAGDPEFVFAREFDAVTIENGPYLYLIARATQEMQPLPRLDFLDPKYTTPEAPIAYLKAEEMHLILAEAALAGGSDVEAAAHIAEAVALADTRETFDFYDTDERKNANLTIRPRDREILVRADADSPLRTDLVLGDGTEFEERGPILNRPVSGTSLAADSVRALGDLFELVHTLYLARQEILFLEGRRMSDLGIRLPIAQREIDASPVIDQGSFGTQVLIPAWIPRNGEMDLFTPLSPYITPREGDELATDEITILVDMNERLAENWMDVSPFLR